MGQLHIGEMLSNVLDKRGVGEEGCVRWVVSITDGVNILPGHCNRQMDGAIRQAITNNIKEGGKPNMGVVTCFSWMRYAFGAMNGNQTTSQKDLFAPFPLVPAETIGKTKSSATNRMTKEAQIHP